MLWILSEVFYPEETGSGYYVTKIAAHLANKGSVSVLCSQPAYSMSGLKTPVMETHDGVRIIRCPCIRLRSRSIAARLLRMATITFSIFIVALFRVRRGDALLAITNPPVLPILAAFLSFALRVPFALLVHDVYPEIMVACGLTSRGSIPFRFLRRLNRIALSRAASVICIGRDMLLQLAEVEGAGVDGRIKVIPLWSDCQEVQPAPKSSSQIVQEMGLTEKLVVLYAGNMGHPQDIESLAVIIKRLSGDESIHFLFIGSGPKLKMLEQLVKQGAKNLTLLAPRPRSAQNEFLNACDLAILTLVPGMQGLAVPSRTYNLMAAGKPIIAMVSESSEVARAVLEEKSGWVVCPGEVETVINLLQQAKSNLGLLEELGRNARRAAETKYSPERILAEIEVALSSVHAV